MTVSQGAVRALALYVPLAACVVLVLVTKPNRRHAAGALLALLWAMPALLLIQLVAEPLHWWTVSVPPGVFPIAGDVWIAWALVWGPIPVLAAWRHPVIALTVALGVDAVAMPLFTGIVRLGPAWLVGEIVALLVVMAPALVLARWTIERRFLPARTLMQMAIFGAWTLWLGPWTAIRTGHTGTPVPSWTSATLAPFALVAATAVQEFVSRGRGTPLPYDPPQQLVTSGVYAYLANPMQTSMTLILVGLGAIMRSPMLMLAAVGATAYGSGLAGWHEKLSMAERFGERWTDYRSNVRAWLPRWRPYVAEPSTIYVAFTCAVCTGVGAWIARRHPVGLRIAAAETLDAPPRRVMYVPADGGPVEYGVAAFARALEHMHLAWAFVAFAIRLPVLRWFVQVVVDACGGGPRDIPSMDADALPACSIRIGVAGR